MTMLQRLFVTVFIIFGFVGIIFSSDTTQYYGTYQVDGVQLIATHDDYSDYYMDEETRKMIYVASKDTLFSLRCDNKKLIHEASLKVGKKSYPFVSRAGNKKPFTQSKTLPVKGLPKVFLSFTVSNADGSGKKKISKELTLSILRKWLRVKGVGSFDGTVKITESSH